MSESLKKVQEEKVVLEKKISELVENFESVYGVTVTFLDVEDKGYSMDRERVMAEVHL